MDLKIREVCEKVLKKSIPTELEIQKTHSCYNNLVDKLKRELKKNSIKANVQIEGSIAKDTWIAGDKDIDIFILLPKKYGRESFKKVLESVKNIAGKDCIEVYSEHPYVQVNVDGFTVDLVPCFQLENSDKILSSVDRTQFHTKYMKERLNLKLKNEIRLLKKFMKGINTYGSEIKVGGFSGYLCEILILKFGSFIELLKVASEWSEEEVIDLEGYYKDLEDNAQRLFSESFIVIDPVDKSRNVASALRSDKLNEFILASRVFLCKPNLDFFYPKTIKILSVDHIIQKIERRGSTIVFLKINTSNVVPDILWGQLYKSQRALKKMVQQHGFKIINNALWSDEKYNNIFILELDSFSLPLIEKHIGPPLIKRLDSEVFLKKYLSSNQTLSGPRIEEGRLIVEKRRRYIDIISLLKANLKEGIEKHGFASLFSKSCSDNSFKVWINHEIKDFYITTPNFASFFTEYLKGKPRWLHSIDS
jgi:tRNA nucleotidyltransferase (CCA-adding enzyme)